MNTFFAFVPGSCCALNNYARLLLITIYLFVIFTLYVSYSSNALFHPFAFLTEQNLQEAVLKRTLLILSLIR